MGLISHYTTFDFPAQTEGGETAITGIRKIGNGYLYIITGFYRYPNNALPIASFVFVGNTNVFGKWYSLNFPNSATTNLYGPSEENNGYNIVGNYTLQNIQGAIGCLYQGALDGSGAWFTIIPSSLSQFPILDTICHSTMGNYLVGNFITHLPKGRAFIYNINTQTYTEIIRNDEFSITAYGIWKNSLNHYTIAGGIKVIGGEYGYVVDWDGNNFYNWKYYSFNNALITHFDGISGTMNPNIYTLTGVYVPQDDPQEKAFYAEIKRKSNGEFDDNAIFKQIIFPNTSIVTGNSVAENIIIGVYKLNNEPNTVHGYITSS